jgi:hypothetical protein
MSEIRTTAYSVSPPVILTLAGGALILAGGLLSLAWSTSFAPVMNGMTCCSMMDGMMMGDMMHGWRSGWIGNQFWFNMMYGMAIAAIASGTLVVISGAMIHKRPQDSSLWGTIGLIFSIVGILGMGGFVIGTILGATGGMLAILKK